MFKTLFNYAGAKIRIILCKIAIYAKNIRKYS